MNEEPHETPVSDREPVDKAVGQNTEKNSSQAENISEVAAAATAAAQEHLATLDSLETLRNPSSEPVAETPEEANEQAKAFGGEPPIDWFEPLEDDEDDDDESLAGESERSWSMAGSVNRSYQFPVPRRRRSRPDKGWDDWPILGEGWKRKEVIRRSGSSVGQKDVYYMSPRGHRVRSRVELISLLEGQGLDLSTFEFKSGKFCEGEVQHTRVRNRAKRKIRERSSSESSWMERGEGADTPDPLHGGVPGPGLKNSHSSQTGVPLYNSTGTPNHEDRIKLPLPSSSRAHLLPAINGDVGSEDNTLVCSRCGISFVGTWYDKQRKRPCCPNCWASSKRKEHPMVRFRKWIPCGQCVGCHNTVNCGQCANCKHGLQSPESRKRICRKRKCICPIRKGPESASLLPQSPCNEIPEMFDDSMSFQSEFADSQHPSLKSSDTENFSVNVDIDLDDDDDMSTDDDDDWHKKRKRRSCGECKACLCRKDCGTCDFCIDKPKFGGSNKKRQKCRLRQCTRQAMRHLLPYQRAQAQFGPEGSMLPGRPRPHYTYSRKSGLKQSRGQYGLDLSDNEDDDLKPMNWNAAPIVGRQFLDAKNSPLSTQQVSQSDGLQNGLPNRTHSNHNNPELDQRSRWVVGMDGQQHVEEDDDDEEEEEEDEDELPMITQIFSLADNPPVSGADVENQLLKLLHSLRSSALPILWYAILVEGPQLQLIQCSKQSNLSDTMVLIDPGFCYQVTVQKQPLLPTHTLYDKYPERLTSVTEVVNLLLGLEEYVVCQGLPPTEPVHYADPIILERASTCDFLVKKKVSVCTNCRALQGL